MGLRFKVASIGLPKCSAMSPKPDSARALGLRLQRRCAARLPQNARYPCPYRLNGALAAILRRQCARRSAGAGKARQLMSLINDKRVVAKCRRHARRARLYSAPRPEGTACEPKSPHLIVDTVTRDTQRPGGIRDVTHTMLLKFCKVARIAGPDHAARVIPCGSAAAFATARGHLRTSAA